MSDTHGHPESKGDASFTIIRALEAGAGKNHRLGVIAPLLQSVLQTARTVIKGTESQRRFNAQFSEFCRAALIALPAWEDAVDDYTAHMELHANNRLDEGMQGLSKTKLLKDLCAYIASQTPTLGSQYLERVAFACLPKYSTDSAPTPTVSRNLESKLCNRKRERAGHAPHVSHITHTPHTSVAVSCRVVPSMSATNDASLLHSKDETSLLTPYPTESTHTSTFHRHDDSLLQSSLTAPESLLQPPVADCLRESLPSNSSGSGGNSNTPAARGLFISRSTAGRDGLSGGRAGRSAMTGTSAGAHRTRDATMRVFDLRDVHQKLTAIDELAPRLQPWTLPIVCSGVVLDRVTADRDRRQLTNTSAKAPSAKLTFCPDERGGPSSQTTNDTDVATTGTRSTSSTTKNSDSAVTGDAVGVTECAPLSPSMQSSAAKSGVGAFNTVPTIFDLCATATPMELLKAWEQREAALAIWHDRLTINNNHHASGASNVMLGGCVDANLASAKLSRTAKSDALDVSPGESQGRTSGCVNKSNTASMERNDRSANSAMGIPNASHGSFAAVAPFDASNAPQVVTVSAELHNFFPRKFTNDTTIATVPPHLLSDLVYHGISSIEFLDPTTTTST